MRTKSNENSQVIGINMLGLSPRKSVRPGLLDKGSSQFKSARSRVQQSSRYMVSKQDRVTDDISVDISELSEEE